MWVPCIGMALCSWLAFVDRQVIAVLSPTIMAETGMNAQEFGRLVTFFFVAYTVGNPLWGSVLDYVGLRAGMLVAVAIWTTASASHAFMGTFLGFAMARAVLGFGEGATFPGGLRTAVESLPPEMRARGIAASFSGGTIGAIVTPLIALPVAAAYGWRAAFVLTGLFGVDMADHLGRDRAVPRFCRRARTSRRGWRGPTRPSAGSGCWCSATRCRPSRRDRSSRCFRST